MDNKEKIGNESMCRHDKIYSWIRFRDDLTTEELLAEREKELLGKRTSQLKMKDRKSIQITDEDISRLQEYLESFKKKVDVIKDSGLDYQVLYMIIKRGTCSESTLSILKEAIPEMETV